MSHQQILSNVEGCLLHLVNYLHCALIYWESMAHHVKFVWNTMF